MGKAQSKRSVDITIETKKGAEDEVTEKMEKIEDLDKKESINGDATLQEKQEQEKKDSDDIENDKDMTTEKSVDIQAGGDTTTTVASNSVETHKEESGSANAEEIFPLADESAKKSKKEKVKKKWSFRSISFGKKDKQKPNKNEESVEDGAMTTNGEVKEKSSKDTEDLPKEKSVNEIEEAISAKSHENGNASHQELNGTELNEEKSNEFTANLTNISTMTEKSDPVQSETTVESSDLPEKSEVTAVPTNINNEINIAENDSTATGVSKNYEESEVSNAIKQDLQKVDVTIIESNETSTQKTSTLADATIKLPASTNGEVVEEIHQNGDNVDQEIVKQSEAQIEVNFNTDNKDSAATFDYFPSNSINPSKLQIHNQDLNANTAKVKHCFIISNYEESVVSKFTDIDKSESILSSIRDIDSDKKIEQIGLSSTEMVQGGEDSKTVKNITDEETPPPLPISPPPSHVSVFVFRNNEATNEEYLPTNNSETVCPLIDKRKEEMLPSHLEVLLGSHKKPGETTKINMNEIVDIVQNSVLGRNNSNIYEEKLQGNLKTDSILEKYNNEESAIAAEVINEITDKAVEVVSRQLETNENVQEKNFLQEAKFEEENEDINDKIVMEVENVVDYKGLADKAYSASLCRKEELQKDLLESTFSINQTKDTTESSIFISASDSIQ